MKIHAIESGYFKLDGGAMYGVVPKQMWKKLNPPDENNMCTWAMRCLLVQDGDRLILIDTGMGDKQDDKFKGHFEPHGPYTLEGSIKAAGYALEEVTDVFLTHLHFDHCGGALYRNSKEEIVPLFPKATYWTNEKHLEWALKPNPRERASFLKENIVPLLEAKVLKNIATEEGIHFTENITVDFYNGHTEALMVPTIHFANGKKIIYPADVLASSTHVRMPYVMSYDIRPLVTLKDKARLYEKVHNDDSYLFFEHDKDVVLGQLKRNGKGRYSITAIDDLDEIL